MSALEVSVLLSMVLLVLVVTGMRVAFATALIGMVGCWRTS